LQPSFGALILWKPYKYFSPKFAGLKYLQPELYSICRQSTTDYWQTTRLQNFKFSNARKCWNVRGFYINRHYSIIKWFRLLSLFSNFTLKHTLNLTDWIQSSRINQMITRTCTCIVYHHVFYFYSGSIIHVVVVNPAKKTITKCMPLKSNLTMQVVKRKIRETIIYLKLNAILDSRFFHTDHTLFICK